MSRSQVTKRGTYVVQGDECTYMHVLVCVQVLENFSFKCRRCFCDFLFSRSLIIKRFILSDGEDQCTN